MKFACGTAKAGADVIVSPSWSSERTVVRADNKGEWLTVVTTPKGSYTPHTITFDDGDGSVIVEDVLVGEVWMSCGQSNMDIPLNGYTNCMIEGAADDIVTSAENVGVRIFTVPRKQTYEPHYTRAQFGSDYLLPLTHIYWNTTFNEVKDYTQHQSFYDGTIHTSFTVEDTRFKICTWFDAVDKDVAAIKINVKGSRRPVVAVVPEEVMNLHYNQRVPQQISLSRHGKNCWQVKLQSEGKEGVFYVTTNADVDESGNRLLLTLKEGDNDILVSYKHPTGLSASHSLKRTVSWWHKKWENTMCLTFPDSDVQRMWVRSMALFLQSYGPEKLGMAPPCTWAGNSWPFPYPQDLSYVHTMFLTSGNIDIAKAWVEYFAERVDGMKSYTKRMLNREGIMAPWVFPYGDFEGYHYPSPPNKFYYEIHNSGYMARMAYETSLFVNDPEWTRRYAYPLIEETARFYRSIATRRSDGYWHLFVEPSMGQDERGGFNQNDYLCALYSAKYCFQKAVECRLDKNGEYAQILNDKLAFKTLKSPDGYYYSCAGSGPDDWGKQKHPVQLNELAFLPTEHQPSQEALKVYQQRYDITMDASKPYFYGWTLGEFLLSGSRVGDTEGWLKDWNNLLPSGYVDKDFLQIYETSKTWNMTYYVITNGLVAQSLVNNLICDWYGKLEVAKCYPWDEETYINNLHSKLGVTISGTIDKRHAKLSLKAWKDCCFVMHEKK